MITWGVSNGKGFQIKSAYNKAKLADFLLKNKDKEIKVEFTPRSQPKSQALLGYYFGALLPFYVAYNKGIRLEGCDSSHFFADLIHQGKITHNEINDAHNTFMTEFRPYIVFDLKGKPNKQRGEMKNMNQREAMMYISQFADYLLENIGSIPNSEEYKKERDEIIKFRYEG